MRYYICGTSTSADGSVCWPEILDDIVDADGAPIPVAMGSAPECAPWPVETGTHVVIFPEGLPDGYHEAIALAADNPNGYDWFETDDAGAVTFHVAG